MSNVQLIMMKIGFKILIIDTLGANARKERHKSLATVFTLLMYLERAEFHHKPKDEDNQANVRH